MKERKRRCYIYTRVSTDIQVEGYSLDAQKERLLRYAEYNELQVVEQFSDEGKSGKNTAGRPQFTEMIRKITNDNEDNIDFVLVFKLSRFGRNAADVLSNLQLMQDYGVNLICVEDSIDSSKDAGKLMISVLSAVAEIERENIRTQTMAGRRQKAREGKWNGGQAPYGYQIDKERGILVVDKEEAEIIRLIYNRFIYYEEGIQRVAKWLNDNGYRRKTRQNGKYEEFSTSFVKNVLDNPVYIGMIAYGRRAHEKIQGKRNEYRVVKKEEYDLYEGQHEAIISLDDWKEVRRRREETGVRQNKTHSLEHEHILSGLLRCPLCDAPMYGSVNRKKKKDGSYYKDSFYYVCKNRKSPSGKSCTYRRQPPQDLINAEVIAVVASALKSPTFAQSMQEVMNERTDEETIRQRLSELMKARKQYVGAKDKLAEQMDTLDVTSPTYDAKYADMSRRLDKLYYEIMETDRDITSAESDLRRLNENKASLENAYRFLALTSETLPKMKDFEKKELINAVVERIEIFPEQREDGRWVKAIYFKFPIIIDGKESDIWSREDKHSETVCLLSKLNVKQHIEVELTMDEMDLTAAEKKASYEEIKEYVLEKFGMKVSHLYIAQVKRKCGIIERENYNKPKSESAKQPQCPPEKEA